MIYFWGKWCHFGKRFHVKRFVGCIHRTIWCIYSSIYSTYSIYSMISWCIASIYDLDCICTSGRISAIDLSTILYICVKNLLCAVVLFVILQASKAWNKIALLCATVCD